MQKGFEKTYHQVEQEHWWFKSRRNYILSLLKSQPRDIKILDIGCSSGLLLTELRQQGFESYNLYGVDISLEAVTRCKRNGITNAWVMDAQNITLKEKFDIIIASDCLEHLKEDDKAVANWSHLLKPGGQILVFVPAFSFLWSSHDVVNMHFRRYTKRALRQKLEKENLHILKASYWNFSLFLPVTLIRLLSRVSPARKTNNNGNLHQMPLFLNSGLLRLMKLENSLLRAISFPFGISTYCIARKPQD